MDEESTHPSCSNSDTEELARAYAILYQVIETVDSDSGETVLTGVKTPLYRTYLDNQSAYHDARLAYNKAYQDAQKTDAERGMWPMVASTLQMPVKSAYAKWRAGGADQIEQALSIINNSRIGADASTSR